MSRTQVDTTPATDEGTLQPPEPYSPPAASTPFSSVRASVYVPRERRLWTAALAAALLVTAGGLGILYVDDTNYQNADRALTSQNEQLTGRTQNLQTALTTTETKLTASENQVSSLTAQLAHPTLGIWNVPQAITGSNYYLAAGVPDTFTYHLKLTSSGPMSVSILSIHQFGDAVRCVETGVGSTNYCMHHSGSAVGWLDVTSVNSDFHLAEGCAAYLAVITAAGSVTVTPDVSVTYNPASAPTGSCA
ncbi:MAG: hypothetical protein ACYDA0_05800 [Candidatus Dormibacteraceae bacterium]